MSRCFCVPLIAATVFFLAGSNVTASDAEPFRVDSYIPERFTDFEWKLDGGFGLSGSQRDQDGQTYMPARYDRYFSSSESDSRSLHFRSNVSYDYVTIPRFLNVGLRVGGSGSASSSESFNDREDTLSGSGYSVRDNEGSLYGLGVSSSLNVGQYLLANLFVSAATSYSYDYSGHPEDQLYSLDSSVRVDDSGWVFSSVNENWSETDSDNKRHLLKAAFTSGWGRIYDGRFAAAAMNMVGELQKASLIEREPGYDELQALTEIVYQYRLKHAIDRRLLRIEALDSAISYLHDRGIISDPGPYGHLLIGDVWDYFGYRQSRPFGWTVSGGVSLDYSKRKYQSGTNRTRYLLSTRHHPDSAGAIDTSSYYDITEYVSSSRRNISSSPALVVRARYARPLNLKWRLDLSAGGKFFIDAYESYRQDETTRRTDYSDYYDIYFNANAAYIYDMRTRISLGALYDRFSRVQLVRIIDDALLYLLEPPRKESSWNLRLLASVTYRISIPTTLNCFLSWNKRHIDWTANDPYRNDYSSYQLSASISHWLY